MVEELFRQDAYLMTGAGIRFGGALLGPLGLRAASAKPPPATASPMNLRRSFIYHPSYASLIRARMPLQFAPLEMFFTAHRSTLARIKA